MNKESRWQQPTAFLIAVLVVLLSGCDAGETGQSTQLVLQGETMGTYYRISMPYSNGQVLDKSHLEELVERSLSGSNALFSTYKVDSQISIFNRLKAGKCLEVDSTFFLLMSVAREVNEKSNGRFNPAVGPLVKLWGFAGTEIEAPPSGEQIQQMLAQVDFSRVYTKSRADSNLLCKRDPVEIDFSAIAKGFAVQRLAQQLDDLSLENYLIDIGGELQARGMNSRGEVWSVAIEEPVYVGQKASSPGGIATVLQLVDKAVATSGNYRNFFEYQGERYSHTLDPATGKPVRHGLLSATVVHDDGALADAWATALMAAGVERAQQLIWENELAALLIVDNAFGVDDVGEYHQKGLVTDGEGDYTLWYTEAFSHHFHEDWRIATQ